MGIKGTIKGMTLIEILLALAILSILAASSIFAVPRYINLANDALRKNDLHIANINLEVYYGFAEQYPESLPGCGQPLLYGGRVIIESMPCDPTTKQPYYYQVKDDDYQAYRLYSLLSDSTSVSVIKVGCLGGCGPDCFYNYGVSSPNTSLVKCSFVCAPGGGRLGSCERYTDPEKSSCPKLYVNDPMCNGECSDNNNKCKNASGKFSEASF